MTDELILGLITFCTSTIAGVVGMGGGLILIAILPMFLPASALIPIHAISQITSNLSRAFFGWDDIQFQVVGKFFLGSILGITLFGSLLYNISFTYIPIFIGVYILLSLWSPKFNKILKKYESYYILGFLQTGLSLFVGATGPLTMTLLFKDFQDRDKVVATGAILMSITHLFKIFTFIALGFAFGQYFYPLAFMIAGAISGSYFGTKIRHLINGQKFILILKVLISVLAFYAIISVFL